MTPEQIIRQAIHDPGQHVPRGDNYAEPLPAWQTREVLAALTAHGYQLVRQGTGPAAELEPGSHCCDNCDGIDPGTCLFNPPAEPEP